MISLHSARLSLRLHNAGPSPGCSVRKDANSKKRNLWEERHDRFRRRPSCRAARPVLHRRAGRIERSTRATISGQAGQDHHSVPGRRRDRHRRTADRAAAVGKTRPAVLHRKHRRRGRQPRHVAGRALAGRRLHRAVRLIQHRGQSKPLRQSAVRSRPGLHPRDQGRRIAERLDRQSGIPGEDDDRDGGPHQARAGQAQRRVAGSRHHALAVDRNAPTEIEARLRHRAFRRRRADDSIAARRPYPDHLRRHRQHDRR